LVDVLVDYALKHVDEVCKLGTSAEESAPPVVARSNPAVVSAFIVMGTSVVELVLAAGKLLVLRAIRGSIYTSVNIEVAANGAATYSIFRTLISSVRRSTVS